MPFWKREGIKGRKGRLVPKTGGKPKKDRKANFLKTEMPEKTDDG